MTELERLLKRYERLSKERDAQAWQFERDVIEGELRLLEADITVAAKRFLAKWEKK